MHFLCSSTDEFYNSDIVRSCSVPFFLEERVVGVRLDRCCTKQKCIRYIPWSPRCFSHLVKSYLQLPLDWKFLSLISFRKDTSCMCVREGANFKSSKVLTLARSCYVPSRNSVALIFSLLWLCYSPLMNSRLPCHCQRTIRSV